LLRTRHSISELLSRAEKDGLIEKQWDLKRKDHVRVVLTHKGKIVTEKTLRGVILPKIMYSLSREERLRLRILLFALFNKALEANEV
jgi:DNA-binding MarR family transcriptional regulator